MKNVLITGTSTGIGLSTAMRLARNGYRVYAGARSPEKAQELRAAVSSGLPIEPVRLDVDDDTSVADAVAEVRQKAGQIDVLVNNAGIPGSGPFELMPLEQGKQVFETNYFGAIRMIQGVLPEMRERRSGTIVNVTSLAGLLAGGCYGHYAASKWALEAASECLATEVRPFGVRVAIIEPGIIATPIFGKVEQPDMEKTPYAQPLRRMMKIFEAQLAQPTPPEAVAEAIQAAMESESPKLRYTVGRDAELLLKWRRGLTDEEWISSELLSDEEFYQAAAKGIGADLFTTSANALPR